VSTCEPALRRLLPDPVGNVDLAEAYAYPEPLSRPWVRANMVSSADGGAWDAAGRSRGLSSPAARAVRAVRRGLSDVILVGAGTARHEGYRPVRPREVWAPLRRGRPTTPRVAVVTRSLELHPDLLDTAPAESPTLVLTTAQAPRDRRLAAERSAEVVVAGQEAVEPALVVAALAERGLHRVLCEGGPHLLAEVSRAELLDELCLTLSPVLAGPGAARITAGEPTRSSPPEDLETTQVLAGEGSLFLRYLTRRGRGR
jgi:riboflavin biosynthesis pyrimidine reductase